MFTIIVLCLAAFGCQITNAEHRAHDLNTIDVLEGDYDYPQPLVELGGKFYYFENNLRTNWFGASDFCRRLGLHLVAVETEEENTLIREHLISIGATFYYFTSGSDQAAWGSYVWTSTGQNMVFSDWAAPQPDHAGTCNATERVIHFAAAYNWKWNDEDPYIADSHFICEYMGSASYYDPETGSLDVEGLDSPVPLVQLGDTFYYFEKILRVNWFAASDFCRRLGLYLTAVETQEENTLIRNHIFGLGVSWDFWSSGSDQTAWNAWTWSSTGENVQLPVWGTGEPSRGGTCNQTERAIVFSAEHNFLWGDRSPYTFEAHFVCEQIK